MTDVINLELKGFCCGIFGRDVDWGCKRIEAAGIDWIVARDEKGSLYFARFEDNEDMERRIKESLESMKKGKEDGELWAL